MPYTITVKNDSLYCHLIGDLNVMSECCNKVLVGCYIERSV